MNIGNLWAPVRFVGQKTKDIKDGVQRRLAEMSEDAFGKESTLQTIIKDNQQKKDVK